MTPLTQLSEEETLFQSSVRRFARERLVSHVREMDAAGVFRRDLLQEFFDLGLMAVEVPEEFGGQGGTFFQCILAIEELARVDPSAAVIVDVQNTLFHNAILRWANAEQKRRWLPRAAKDTVAGYALSEAGSGSDAFALATRAIQDGDSWLLAGRKLWITNAAEAGFFLLFANVNPALGYKGITAFLVERNFPGFQVGKKEDKLGIRASSTCELILDNCRVPAANVVGEVGKGYKIAIETLNEGRIGIGAQMLGLAQGALDHALAYARQRKQFGSPIAEFQGVQFELAEMAVEVEATRLMVYNAARLHDAGRPFLTEAAMCKYFASQVAERTASRAVEILGGVGFTKDYPVEKLYRDAKIGRIYEGTSNMQKMTIAKQLLGKGPFMTGLMMDYPLTLTHILERAAKIYPTREIASRLDDRSMHRYTYHDFHHRVHRLAHALDGLGVEAGDRIGTLCWNSSRHLELYFAVPCAGAVLHTLNPRLSADQLAYIIDHAGDIVIFVDPSLLPILEAIRSQLKTVRHVVVLDDLGYELLLAGAPESPYDWPALDENAAAAMCYTSGTTGHPKGVLYSHRSIFLHNYGLCMADTFALRERDTILQLVPMFHANGWGTPYAGIMTGSRLVFCGRHVQPDDIALLIQNERVTFSGGVPTLWMTLYSYLESHPHDISTLRMVVAAGSALPRRFVELYEKKYGVHFMLGWGMTEITPIGTLTSLQSHHDSLSSEQRFDLMARHGLPLAGVDIRIVDPEGADLRWDGIATGELQVRGPWVTSGYYNDPRSLESFALDSSKNRWLRTGDVAAIDAEGYLQIMDRTKDMVKSGGEWISSVDLENAIMAHPKVAEAAVVGVFHPKWQERPLACVVPHAEHRDQITKQEILDFLVSRVAKWWLPDDVVFIDAVPKTSVGKFNKRALRERFKDYTLPGAEAAG